MPAGGGGGAGWGRYDPGEPLSSHHVFWTSCAHPTITGAAAILLGTVTVVTAVEQTLMASFFWIMGVGLLLLGASHWLVAGSAFPIVCKHRPQIRDTPAPHDASLTIHRYVTRTNLVWPRTVRTIVQLLTTWSLFPIMAVVAVIKAPQDRIHANAPVQAWAAVLAAGSLVLFFWRTAVLAAIACRRKCRARGQSQAVVTVMQFNIAACTLQDGTFDRDAVAKTISAAAPDVVALQQVERSLLLNPNTGAPLTEPRKGEDHLRYIATSTNMQIVFGSATTAYGGDYGVALLVKPGISIVSSHVHQLATWHQRSSDAWGPPLPRTVLFVRLAIAKCADDVVVACVELGNDASGVEQLYEVQEVWQSFQRLVRSTARGDGASAGAGGAGGAGAGGAGGAGGVGAGAGAGLDDVNPAGSAGADGAAGACENLVLCGNFACRDDGVAMRVAAALGWHSVSQWTGSALAALAQWHRQDHMLVNSAGRLRPVSVTAGANTAKHLHAPLVVRLALTGDSAGAATGTARKLQ